ncbi:MAG: hypothetical protein FJ125_07885 [Deltaproteobacteria bacterium]|nr:hypothetical protein [Deltaproteobacteria bacterium]
MAPAARPPAAPAAPAVASGRVAHYKQVYADLLSKRTECRQGTEGMSFEAIAQRMEASRASLIASSGYRDVTFKVVVEDGKAKLKAVPIAK